MRKEVIVGHTYKKKKDNRLAVISVVVLVVLFFVSLKFLEKSSVSKPEIEKQAAVSEKTPVPEKTSAPSYLPKTESLDVRVAETITSKNISGNQPESASDVFSPGERVYFYTKISSGNMPLAVKHVFVNSQGSVYSSIDLHAYNNPADVWSYIILPSSADGEWTAKAVVDDETVAAKSFRVE